VVPTHRNLTDELVRQLHFGESSAGNDPGNLLERGRYLGRGVSECTCQSFWDAGRQELYRHVEVTAARFSWADGRIFWYFSEEQKQFLIA
jgi:hypothetical protein